MKISKMIAVFGAAVLLVSAASASGLNTATKGNISNDADNFIDVNDWQKVTFKNVFAEAAIDSNNLDFGAGTKIGSGYGAFSYLGNTWSATPTNTFAVLYGTGDLGVKVGYQWATATDKTYGYVTDNTYDPFLEVGYNLKASGMNIALKGLLGNSRVSFSGNNMINGTGQEITGGVNTFSMELGGTVTFPANGVIVQSVGLYYYGEFINVDKTVVATYAANKKTGEFATKASSSSLNGLLAFYKADAKLNDTFEYAGRISFDYDITNSILFSKVINAFQAYVVPKVFAVNAYLVTDLPDINDTNTGSLTNSMNFGTTWNINPSFTVESAASLSGVTFSCDEIWNTYFSLYLMARF